MASNRPRACILWAPSGFRLTWSATEWVWLILSGEIRDVSVEP